MKSRFSRLPTCCATMLIAGITLTPQFATAANLSEIYQLAVSKDSVIQASRAQYEAAIAALPLARSSLRPQVALSADIGINEDDDDLAGVYGSNTIGASISQFVYNPTASRTVKKAKVTVEQAEASLKEAEQTLMFRTSQAYFNVLTAREAFGAASSSREAIAQQTEQAERRFDVGLAAITDVKEAQAQLDLAIAREVVAENQLALSREALRVIINQDVPPLDGLKEDAALTAPDPASVDEWITVATSNNPRLDVARKDFELAQADLSIERAGRLPTLAIVGGYQNFQSSRDVLNRFAGPDDPARTTTNTDRETGQIKLQLEYPLYTGGRTNALVEQATSRTSQASFNLETVRRAVVQETRDAYLTVLADISQTNALQQALNSTEVAKDATQAGFDAGTRTAVEVLVSLRDTFSAYADYTAARHQYVVSSLQLRLASGILAQKHIDAISNSMRPGF